MHEVLVHFLQVPELQLLQVVHVLAALACLVLLSLQSLQVLQSLLGHAAAVIAITKKINTKILTALIIVLCIIFPPFLVLIQSENIQTENTCKEREYSQSTSLVSH